MDDEAASEAIDGDVDHIYDPDSMEVLMGEMEMPFESACNNCYKNCDIKENACLPIPTSLSPTFYKGAPTPKFGLNNQPALNTNRENEFEFPRSFKECPGFAKIIPFENDQFAPTPSDGFIASKELKATLDGSDPIPGLRKVYTYTYIPGWKMVGGHHKFS